MAPPFESATEPDVKKPGRGRPRKGEERVKKVYVPTGRPRGRPKGSRNAKSVTPTTSAVGPETPDWDLSQTPTLVPSSAPVGQYTSRFGDGIATNSSIGMTGMMNQAANTYQSTMNGNRYGGSEIGIAQTGNTGKSLSEYMPTATGRPRGRPRKDGLPPQPRKTSSSTGAGYVSGTNITEVEAVAALQSDGKVKRGRGRPRKNSNS